MLIQYPFMFVLLLMITGFPFLNHPLAMGLNLLFSTLLISLTLGVMSINFWVPYTLMLILTGGLLVIFVYISLLASNEKFFMTWSLSIFLFCLSSVFLLMFLNFELDLNHFFGLNLEYHLKFLYDVELFRMTFFIVFYLLLTLLVVVYNTKKNSYPLRSVK